MRSTDSTLGPRVNPWRGLGWAWSASPAIGCRALLTTLRSGKALRRWAAVVEDLRRRGLVEDPRREYLRPFRPFVHRQTGVVQRIAQLIDHLDWLETAFQPSAYEHLARGRALTLAELPPPHGHESMRLQLQRNLRGSPEGEMLLTLVLRRSRQVQPAAPELEVAALAFTRMRVQSAACLAIGGVRGQRDPHSRVSATEVSQALHGWKAPVFMVRVAQELARWWGLQLVGLDPAWHRLHAWPTRWSPARREIAKRIGASYAALWDHFEAQPGPYGWVRLPLQSDQKLEATARSPERRQRQVRRADFWIRTRQLLRDEFRRHLVRQAPEALRGAVTQNLGPKTVAAEASAWDDADFEDSEQVVPSRSLDTGPGELD